jgi:hypothetical protein
MPPRGKTHETQPCFTGTPAFPITDAPRADHPQYLDNWFRVLKADRKGSSWTLPEILR